MKPDERHPPQPMDWTPELVAEFWDGLARIGLDDVFGFGDLAKRCIHWLLARHLTPGGRHLDYGAGNGDVAAYLIEKGFPFAVLEPSKNRQQKTADRLSHVEGFLGALNDGSPRQFDAVTCFEVLEHILDQDLEAFCDHLSSYVRPGGKLMISTPNCEDLSQGMVYCPMTNRYFHRWQHVRSISPSWICEIFEHRGFDKICVHQLDFSEALYEPYLHMMGYEASKQAAACETVPLHIHEINHDIDTVCGGATNLLFIGRKRG